MNVSFVCARPIIAKLGRRQKAVCVCIWAKPNDSKTSLFCGNLIVCQQPSPVRPAQSSEISRAEQLMVHQSAYLRRFHCAFYRLLASNKSRPALLSKTIGMANKRRRGTTYFSLLSAGVLWIELIFERTVVVAGRVWVQAPSLCLSKERRIVKFNLKTRSHWLSAIYSIGAFFDAGFSQRKLILISFHSNAEPMTRRQKEKSIRRTRRPSRAYCNSIKCGGRAGRDSIVCDAKIYRFELTSRVKSNKGDSFNPLKALNLIS